MQDEQLERTRKALDRISENISNLDKAHRLAEEGNYEKALDACLLGLHGRVGTRLQDLKLQETIDTLIKNYSPAREEFEKRRDAFEMDLKDGRHTRMLHEEWTAINKALGDDYREVEFLKQLRDASTQSEYQKDVTAHLTVKYNLPKYLEDRRYDVIEPHLNVLGTLFLTNYSMGYEKQKYFPDGKPQSGNFEIEQILTDGPIIYEACLGLKRVATADEIARKVLTVSRSRKTFRSLLKAAQRVGNKEQVKALLKLAKRDLPQKSFEGLKKDLQV